MDHPVVRALMALMPGVALAVWGSAAWAHMASDSMPPGWTWDASVTVPLLLSLALFGVGWLRLKRRTRRGSPGLRRRSALFLAGWTSLAAAVVSPLHQAGERAFSLHMVEHEVLMLVAAPLLVWSEPLAVMLWAFPAFGRRGFGMLARARPVAALWRGATQPVAATLVQAAVLWLWHAPTLFDLALADPTWHVIQHLCFLISALLFWSAMRRPGPAGAGVAVLCLFATSVVSGALGALMAFSESPWYAAYASTGADPFGLSPAEDQQIAGLLMWIPGGLVHAGAALAMIAHLVRREARAGGPANAL
jgi:putative membrane protein